MIAAIVLAAGLSRRMGQAKLLLKLGGRAIIRHAVESVSRRAAWTWCVVVTGPDVEPIEAALAGIDVRIAVNPAPEAGQAGSVRAGIAALPPRWTRCSSRSATSRRRAARGHPGAAGGPPHEPGKLIVAPRYRGRAGQPRALRAPRSFPSCCA